MKERENHKISLRTWGNNKPTKGQHGKDKQAAGLLLLNQQQNQILLRSHVKILG